MRLFTFFSSLAQVKIQVARFSQKVIDFKSMCIESITATKVITRYDQQEFSFIRKNRCYYTETNCSFPLSGSTEK